MNCPECGARNTADAPWCTQCLHPLGPTASDTTPPVAPAPPPAPDGPDVPVESGAPTGSVGEVDRPFRTVDGEVEWRCPACASWNPLTTPTCPVCGQELASSERGSGRLADRVARARRPLWIVAGVAGLLTVGGIIMLLLVLRAGAGA